MASDNAHKSSNGPATDLAKALQELAKGERTATALENHLTVVEAKIEALLAQAEKQEADAQVLKEKRLSSARIDTTATRNAVSDQSPKMG